MKKPKAENIEARKRLESLRDSLDRNNYIWAAKALDDYLTGKAETLDDAFGVRVRRGLAKSDSTATRDLRVIQMRREGHSWKKIADEVGYLSDREPRRLLDALDMEFVPKNNKQRAMQIRAHAAAARLIYVELMAERD